MICGCSRSAANLHRSSDTGAQIVPRQGMCYVPAHMFTCRMPASYCMEHTGWLANTPEMRLLAQNPLRYRRQILALKQFFTGRQCTVLMLGDRTSEVTDLQLQRIAQPPSAPVIIQDASRI